MTAAQNKWTVARARDWHKSQGWIVGCNFLPSYAVNFMDFWHEARFDENVIDRELSLAAKTGLNAVRVNLNFLVWRHEGMAHLSRIDRFLEIADSYKIKVVLVPFDDCQFSGAPPEYKRQPPPLIGTHNSRAIGSPGREIVMEWQNHPDLEVFFRTILNRYKTDGRVLFWDLYNEPSNRMQFIDNKHSEFDLALEAKSFELMENCFKWARDINPDQPLTVGAWHLPLKWDHSHLPQEWESESAVFDEGKPYCHKIDRRAFELSDIISFHGYITKSQMEALLSRLEKFDRPLMLTEWLARPAGSRVEDQLPLFAKHNVGCFHWGLVNGNTQTHLPWPFLGIEPDEWFHDLYKHTGAPYAESEIALFQKLANMQR